MFQTIEYKSHFIHVKTMKGKPTIISYCIMRGNIPIRQTLAKSIHAAKLAITKHNNSLLNRFAIHTSDPILAGLLKDN